MSSMADYLEAELLKHLFRTTSFSKPSALHISLFTVAPAEDNTGGTEVSGGAYARVQLDPSDANWTLAGSVISNTGDITYPAPTADWAAGVTKIVAMGIHDAATAGNLLFVEILTTQKNVNNGDAAPKFPAGTLTITAD